MTDLTRERVKAAIDELDKVNPQHGTPITDEQFKMYEANCAVYMCLHHETIEQALSERENLWTMIK